MALVLIFKVLMVLVVEIHIMVVEVNVRLLTEILLKKMVVQES